MNMNTNMNTDMNTNMNTNMNMNNTYNGNVLMDVDYDSVVDSVILLLRWSLQDYMKANAQLDKDMVIGITRLDNIVLKPSIRITVLLNMQQLEHFSTELEKVVQSILQRNYEVYTTLTYYDISMDMITSLYNEAIISNNSILLAKDSNTADVLARYFSKIH